MKTFLPLTRSLLNVSRFGMMIIMNTPLVRQPNQFDLVTLSVKHMRSIKSKRKRANQTFKYKLKTHQGLAKRIIIVGDQNDRMFKFKSPCHHHKMIKKTFGNRQFKAN